MRTKERINADVVNYKAHAEDGIHFLTDINPAPEAFYYGFIVTGEDVIISDITYIDDTKVTGDITAITLVQGGYYPITTGFSTITLTTGDLMLLKRVD